MKTTNFDRYLEAQLKDPEFAERFETAGEAWEEAESLDPDEVGEVSEEPDSADFLDKK